MLRQTGRGIFLKSNINSNTREMLWSIFKVRPKIELHYCPLVITEMIK